MRNISTLLNSIIMAIVSYAILRFFDLLNSEIILYVMLLMFFIFVNLIIDYSIKKTDIPCCISCIAKVQYYTFTGTIFGFFCGIFLSWIVIFPYSYFFGHPDLSWTSSSTTIFILISVGIIIGCVFLSARNCYKSAKNLFIEK